ncbi:hypothetical protein [Candidatus Phytoplasma sacchari]|uniref:DUF3267 domain-containing protein n=1 Tax=Candidatus Phytoplasma sacchari TaxID=2609813 RepID=A0ABY7M0S2_9MOLU|nr:hypothetical protein O7R10_01245 [Candidatus Phytoplasma sacchari]
MTVFNWIRLIFELNIEFSLKLILSFFLFFCIYNLIFLFFCFFAFIKNNFWKSSKISEFSIKQFYLCNYNHQCKIAYLSFSFTFIHDIFHKFISFVLTSLIRRIETPKMILNTFISLMISVFAFLVTYFLIYCFCIFLKNIFLKLKKRSFCFPKKSFRSLYQEYIFYFVDNIHFWFLIMIWFLVHNLCYSIYERIFWDFLHDLILFSFVGWFSNFLF